MAVRDFQKEPGGISRRDFLFGAGIVVAAGAATIAGLNNRDLKLLDGLSNSNTSQPPVETQNGINYAEITSIPPIDLTHFWESQLDPDRTTSTDIVQVLTEHSIVGGSSLTESIKLTHDTILTALRNNFPELPSIESEFEESLATNSYEPSVDTFGSFSSLADSLNDLIKKYPQVKSYFGSPGMQTYLSELVEKDPLVDEDEFWGHMGEGDAARREHRFKLYELMREAHVSSGGNGPRCVHYPGRTGPHYAFIYEVKGHSYKYIVWIYNHLNPARSTPIPFKTDSRLERFLNSAYSNGTNTRACLGEAFKTLKEIFDYLFDNMPPPGVA